MEESILIVPLDPNALDEKEFALIKRDLVELGHPTVRDSLAEAPSENESLVKGTVREKAKT